MKIYGFRNITGTLLSGTIVEVEEQHWGFNTYCKRFCTPTSFKVGVEKEQERIAERLFAFSMGWFYYMYEVLDWTIIAHPSPVAPAEGVSKSQGVLLIADSRTAMIKGLRKLSDMKGTDPSYVIKAQGDTSLGIAVTDLYPPKGLITSTTLAALANMKHNAKERMKRAGLKLIYNLLPQSHQQAFIKYAKEKVSLDHMMSISGGISEAKTNKVWASMGYAVYIAPTEHMPSGQGCVRVIGSTITLAQIASHVQRSTDNEGSRMGGIFN